MRTFLSDATRAAMCLNTPGIRRKKHVQKKKRAYCYSMHDMRGCQAMSGGGVAKKERKEKKRTSIFEQFFFFASGVLQEAGVLPDMQ
jgi:hypothetical protein